VAHRLGLPVVVVDRALAPDHDVVAAALGPDADLSEALPAVAAGHSCALVIDEGRLIGLLTTENLSEYLLLRRFGMDPTPAPAR